MVGSVDGCTEITKVTDHTPFGSKGALKHNETSYVCLRISCFSSDCVLVVPLEGNFR